jgi:SHS2 domain-containing protein
MSYRWLDHTAELELEIEAATEEAVFRDAAAALAELLDDGATGAPAAVELEVAGSDSALLLVDWLEELVYRAETEDLVPEAVDGLELRADALTARLRGHRGNPRNVVKGVTLHRLSFEAGERGFRASVVLDV